MLLATISSFVGKTLYTDCFEQLQMTVAGEPGGRVVWVRIEPPSKKRTMDMSTTPPADQVAFLPACAVGPEKLPERGAL